MIFYVRDNVTGRVYAAVDVRNTSWVLVDAEEPARKPIVIIPHSKLFSEKRFSEVASTEAVS